MGTPDREFQPDQLVRLLKVGVERDDAPADPTSVGQAVDDVLSLSWTTASGPATVGELLLAAETDVTTLRALKDHAKDAARRERCPDERGAWTLVYYAALAAACARHGKIITNHSPKTLREGMASLREKPWTPRPLAELLDEAWRALETSTSE
jgi:hypothetical protein